MALEHVFIDPLETKIVLGKNSIVNGITATAAVRVLGCIDNEKRSPEQRSLYHTLTGSENQAAVGDFFLEIDRILSQQVAPYRDEDQGLLDINGIRKNQSLMFELDGLRRVGNNHGYFLFNPDTVMGRGQTAFESLVHAIGTNMLGDEATAYRHFKDLGDYLETMKQ